jgi:hypothetical protein
MRRANQQLEEENARLKKILRENGIAWSSVALEHLDRGQLTKRRTRSYVSLRESKTPYLPTEVLLRILKYALKSPYPLIDPLSPLDPENLTDEEKSRGNQIAIHFLATCKALHFEGTKYLWESNTFTFTTPEAVRNFAELRADIRATINTINFRIVARYYDDQRRKHKLEKCYHADLKKDQQLKVAMRPKETPLIRGGFRCYTWSQIVDFLHALRAPYDPAVRISKQPRPRLLPSLVNMRLDLVNFSDTLLPFSGSELHDITSHELGCTLNELQVTGMPIDDTGMKAAAELSGMLKDEGLYLDGPATFIAKSKHLQRLGGSRWCPRVVRASKGGDGESLDSEDEDGHDYGFLGPSRPSIGALPSAPKEEGHPVSGLPDESVVWKRVPLGRDDEKRVWMQFSRSTGYEISDFDEDEDEDRICPCCGEAHPSSSLLDYMMEDELE